MIVPSQLTLKTHTNFECALSLATLDKLEDRFPLAPGAPPIGDTSLTYVIGLRYIQLRDQRLLRWDDHL
ncbi:unnamed protein product [Tenebrio molitor]|jgi:hypothetical protein|nr:unnamed protein product [Tenebrio molitor]